MLTPIHQAELVPPRPKPSLVRSVAARSAAIPAARDTSADPNTTALAHLARLLGRAAAADHLRRGGGFSIWEIAIPMGIIGSIA